MRATRPKSQRGFSLMEIMLAMLLLGASGVSLLSAFVNASSTLNAPENIAFGLGSQRLARLNEYVRDDRWGNTNAVVMPLSYDGPWPPPAAETIPAVGGKTYTPDYTVNDLTDAVIDQNGDGIEDYRKVNIVVSWP